MSYYTVVPIVKNEGDGYTDNFCEGKWQVFYNDNWIQLNPLNTRVRDKDNRTWIEVCDGHMVEVSVDDPNLDCQCYSKNYNDSLNRSIEQAVTLAATEYDIVLYGSVHALYDTSQFLYIAYTTKMSDKYSLRLYVLNKESSLIDSIVVDTLNTLPNNIIVNTDSDYNIKIGFDSVVYKIAGDYTINAYYNVEPLTQTLSLSNDNYTIKDGTLYINGMAKFGVASNIISLILYEDEPCIVQYESYKATLYNVDGVVIGESDSDANSVYFFCQQQKIVSLEAYDTYFRIKGVES